MTEKRFTAFTDYLGGTQTILDNGERKTLQELLDTMNELAEENEQLKDALNQRTEQCDKYYEENEQLKQELSEQGTQLDFLKDENKHMRDLVNENEQLKKKCEYMEDVLNNQGYEVVFNGERWVIE